MRKLSLLIFIIPFSTKLYGQLNLQQKISVSARQVTLENFLNRLETEFHVIQSYGMDNVNGKCVISIEAENTRLMDLLLEAADQCNLQFTVIGETIVFKSKTSLPVPVREVKGEETIPIIHDQLFNTIPSRVTPLQTILVKTNSIKIPTMHIKRDAATKRIHAHRKQTLSVFSNYGLDINYYAFRQRELDFQFFKTKPTPVLGLGLSYRIKKHWSAAVTSSWSSKEFTLHHNFQVQDEEDPFPIMNQTTVEMKYRELSFAVNYHVNLSRYHHVSFSVNYTTAHLYLQDEVTTYLNAKSKSTSLFIDEDRQHLSSVALGMSYDYQLGRSWNVSVEPVFGFYTSSPNENAITRPSRILRTRLTLAYKIFK